MSSSITNYCESYFSKYSNYITSGFNINNTTSTAATATTTTAYVPVYTSTDTSTTNPMLNKYDGSQVGSSYILKYADKITTKQFLTPEQIAKANADYAASQAAASKVSSTDSSSLMQLFSSLLSSNSSSQQDINQFMTSLLASMFAFG